MSVEGATDILGNKRPSYLDYVDLWRHMMDPTLMKVSRLSRLCSVLGCMFIFLWALYEKICHGLEVVFFFCLLRV